METERNLNAKILAKILELKAKYPELSGPLNSMSVAVSNENSPEINIKELEDYYDSINAIL